MVSANYSRRVWQSYAGECGFNNLILYGSSFFKFDVSVSRRFNIDEKCNVELRATFLDALNHLNFRVGGFNAGVISIDVGGLTFGQLGSGSAYQDISTTNDPGGDWSMLCCESISKI